MEISVKTANGLLPLTKSYISHVRSGSKYASAMQTPCFGTTHGPFLAKFKTTSKNLGQKRNQLK